MNERIKELLEQSGVKYVTMPKDTVYEKFAELIIRECTDTVTDRCEMRNESDIKRAEYYARRIKDHFGLQE
jgi:uncharacterized protein YqgV (UPF0045/DUF77 family)